MSNIQAYVDYEVLVGKWFNNNLYRKVIIHLSALPNNSSIEIPHEIDNLSAIVMLHGRASDGTNYIPLPYANNQPELNIMLSANKTNVTIQTGSDRRSYTTTSVVLYYTKTED